MFQFHQTNLWIVSLEISTFTQCNQTVRLLVCRQHCLPCLSDQYCLIFSPIYAGHSSSFKPDSPAFCHVCVPHPVLRQNQLWLCLASHGRHNNGECTPLPLPAGPCTQGHIGEGRVTSAGLGSHHIYNYWTVSYSRNVWVATLPLLIFIHPLSFVLECNLFEAEEQLFHSELIPCVAQGGPGPWLGLQGAPIIK